MTHKTVAIAFLLVSLLTQQVSAAVMEASMFGNMSSSMSADMSQKLSDMNQLMSSEMSSGEMMMNMPHQHHPMGSQMDDDMSHGDMDMSMMDIPTMDSMDCFQNDCATCSASCQFMMLTIAVQFSSVISKEVIQQNPSEPLVQSPTSPFRPPIVA